MTQIQPITLANAEGKARDLLQTAKNAIGKEINLISGLANAPAALEGYLNFNAALAGGALTAKLRESLALTSAGFNHCNYCASAHTFIGGKLGVAEDELSANLLGTSTDSKTQAAIIFASQLLEKRGRVEERDIAAVRKAGFSDEEVIEILAHVALNVFTNYFNVAFQTEIDFPEVNTKLN